MEIDRGRLYDAAEDFFRENGSVVMKLTPAAAIEVCELAADRGLLIARIEGGFWTLGRFEARLDCIWDGEDPPITRAATAQNNAQAAEYLKQQSERHSAFILTAPSIDGWATKQGNVAL